MSKFTIEVFADGFVSLQTKSEVDFVNVVRSVHAGDIKNADCVYYKCSTFEYTWYKGCKYYEVLFLVEEDFWDSGIQLLPEWEEAEG